MKKNEIDLKTVKTFIERQQFTKLSKCIEGRQLDKEAALKCFECPEVIYSIVDNYTFEELFDGNLVKFIKDGQYFPLGGFVDAKTSKLWMSCFFKNSDELLEVYEYIKRNYPGESIKDIIMPQRGCTKTYGDFKEDYYNCLDGIEKILMEQKREMALEDALADGQFTAVTAEVWNGTNPVRDTSTPFPTSNSITSAIPVPSRIGSEYTYILKDRIFVSNKDKIIDMLQTMPILKWSIVEKYIAKLGLTIEEVETMLRDRFYDNQNHSLVDLEGVISILDGFKEKYGRGISINYLAYLINPTHLDSEESTMEGKRLIYNKYMSNLININLVPISRNVALNALAFETDETRADKIFDLLLTDMNTSSVSDLMKRFFGSFNYPVLVTKHMFEVTKNKTCHPEHILFPDVQLTADEVIGFVNEIYSFSLLEFNYNPFALRAIQLETYSEEDMEKLKPYLLVNRLSSYFKNNFIPFDFAMKYITHIDGLRLRCGNINKYTAEQLVDIVKSDLYTSDKYNNQYIFKNFLERKDVTDELFARVITIIGETNRDGSYGMCKSESKASLKNILTLLN